MKQDDITRKTEEMWDQNAMTGGRYAVPSLDLDREQLRQFARGEIDQPETIIYPRSVLRDVEGKDVLCLASGGGHQSVVFGLLGANVTVLDLSAGQLNGDRVAAEHYGYDVRLVKGDMRDLSVFDDASFDLIYQPISITFVPDVKEVYREVHRVLRPGGVYSVHHCNPSTYPTSFVGGANGWDGEGYRIAEPYMGGPILVDSDGRENMTCGEPIGEYRHLLRDIFGGLLELGFQITEVLEDPRHLRGGISGEPGSYEHSLDIIAEYFSVTCMKPA